MKKISVIVPFYNGRKTIARCISSILAQTYKNFELIMVSDGSTDDSCNIVRKFMGKDSRIKLIECIHRGVSATRNSGIELATGDFIQFIDSDDYIERNMFKIMLNNIIKYNADMVVCNYYHPIFTFYIDNKILNLKDKKDAMIFYQNTFASQVPWNKLFKREVITENFEETVAFCEDELFVMANMKNVGKTVILREKLYNYYVAPDENSSCINAIASDNDFWKNKNTFWYKRSELMPLSREIFSGYMPKNDAEDFVFVRIFDFMIWEMIIFLSKGVNINSLIYDIQSIFNEKDFSDAMAHKSKYGVHIKTMSKAQRDDTAGQFVTACVTAYNAIMSNGLMLRPFYVFMDFFVSYFIDSYDITSVDTVDFVAAEIIHLLREDTMESHYVNLYMNMYSDSYDGWLDFDDDYADNMNYNFC